VGGHSRQHAGGQEHLDHISAVAVSQQPSLSMQADTLAQTYFIAFEVAENAAVDSVL